MGKATPKVCRQVHPLAEYNLLIHAQTTHHMPFFPRCYDHRTAFTEIPNVQACITKLAPCLFMQCPNNSLCKRSNWWAGFGVSIRTESNHTRTQVMLQAGKKAALTLRAACPTLQAAAPACQRLYHKNVRLVPAIGSDSRSLACDAYFVSWHCILGAGFSLRPRMCCGVSVRSLIEVQVQGAICASLHEGGVRL